MFNFNGIDKATFLNDYWQKKPCVFRKALPTFQRPLSADELAGLAMDEDIESRLVLQNPWQLKQGPFKEKTLTSLPDSPWTLLVQGLDRFIPEVNALLDDFDFIPQWRIDDIMISLANMGGGVGPHYDNYDVFLYQAKGTRQWSLTSKECHAKNIIADLELRLMAVFETEEEHVLEEGDLLYLPSHIGHDGVSLSEECMTYSFGYRSYQAQELWDGFADYMSSHSLGTHLYKDPNWSKLQNPAMIPHEAVMKAKKAMQILLDDDKALKHWFSSYTTLPDQHAENYLPEPLEKEHWDPNALFEKIANGLGLARDLNSRLAYHMAGESYFLYINGERWEGAQPSLGCLKEICVNRYLSSSQINDLCQSPLDKDFIFELYTQQILTEMT